MGFGAVFHFNVEFFAATLTIYFGFGETVLGPHWVDLDDKRYLFRVIQYDGKLRFEETISARTEKPRR